MVKQMIPVVEWAQDKKRLYFKYQTTDPVQENSLKVNIENNKLQFLGTGKSTFYRMIFQFNKKVQENSVRWKHGRNVEVMIMKADEGFWPHPMAKEDKRRLKKHTKIDWDKFVDEDDLEDQAASPLDSVNLGGLPDFLKPHVAKMQAQKEAGDDGTPVEEYVPPMKLLKRLGYGKRTGTSDDEELDWEIEDRRKAEKRVRRQFSWRKEEKEDMVIIPPKMMPKKVKRVKPKAQKVDKPSEATPTAGAAGASMNSISKDSEEEDVD